MDAATSSVTIQDLLKLDLRAGVIQSAEKHLNADKLLILHIDIGDKVIVVVAGIASVFTPSDLVGKQVVVLVNIQASEFRGVLSEGMLLGAGTTELIDLVTVDAPPGSPVR